MLSRERCDVCEWINHLQWNEIIERKFEKNNNYNLIFISRPISFLPQAFTAVEKFDAFPRAKLVGRPHRARVELTNRELKLTHYSRV